MSPGKVRNAIVWTTLALGLLLSGWALLSSLRRSHRLVAERSRVVGEWVLASDPSDGLALRDNGSFVHCWRLRGGVGARVEGRWRFSGGSLALDGLAADREQPSGPRMSADYWVEEDADRIPTISVSEDYRGYYQRVPGAGLACPGT